MSALYHYDPFFFVFLFFFFAEVGYKHLFNDRYSSEHKLMTLEWYHVYQAFQFSFVKPDLLYCHQ